MYCLVSLNEYCIIQNSNSEKPDTMTDCIHTASLRQRTKTSQLNASRTRCDRSTIAAQRRTLHLDAASSVYLSAVTYSIPLAIPLFSMSSRLTIRFGKRDGALGCCALAIAVTLFAFHPRALSDDRSLQ